MKSKLISRIKNSFIDFGKYLFNFFKKVASIFQSNKQAVKSKYFYLLICLFIGTIAFGAVGFRYSNVNFKLSAALYFQDTIFKENYIGYKMSLPIIEQDNSENYEEWSDIGNRINYQCRTASFALTKAVENNKPLEFTVIYNSNTIASSEICDIYSYRSEIIDSNTFSPIDLYKEDTSSNGQMLISYPFDGKDAGSYIPFSLAKKIVDSDDNLNSIKEVLGLHYSLVVNGRQFNLSINNIYYEDSISFSGKTIGTSGKMFALGANKPIITDLVKENQFWDSRAYVFSKGDMSASLRTFNSLKQKTFSNSDEFSFAFVNDSGDCISTSATDQLIKTGLIESFSKKTIYIVFALLGVSCCVVHLILGIFCSIKGKKYYGFALFNILEMTAYLTVILFFRIIVRDSLKFFLFNNIFVATASIIVPVCLFTIFVILGGKVENE